MESFSRVIGWLHEGWVDLAAGTLAGFAQVVSGHPFDTVKVRLQVDTEGRFRGPMDCVRKTLQKEGAQGFFKGMSSPLIGVGLVNAALFYSYGRAMQGIVDMRLLGAEPGKEATPLQAAVAGGFAGVFQCFIVCPTELVKLRLQTQYDDRRKKSGKVTATPADHVRYSGPLDCVRSILRTEGVRGLFRGMTSTVYRELPGYAGYFGTYELCKRLMAGDGPTSELSPLALFVAGGIGGISCWVLSYPQDVIKTKIQMHTTRKYQPHLGDGGFAEAGKRWKGLWKGFSPTIVRAFPANASAFLVYELSTAAFQRYMA